MRIAGDEIKGFTIAEVLIALLIIGLAVIATISAAAFAERSLVDGVENVRSESLIVELEEEVASMPRESVSPATPRGSAEGLTNLQRSDFKSIFEYDGLLEAPPRDPLGGVIPGYEKYTRKVSMRFVDSRSSGTEIPWGSGKLVEVTVRVTRDGIEIRRAVFLRSVE